MELLIIMIIVGLAVAGFVFLFRYTGDNTSASAPVPQSREGTEAPRNSPLCRADQKGRYGEEEIGRILESLPEEEYIVLNDVLLPLGHGMTQIDHVIISVYGIFVIEAKNYQGKIYGAHDSERWTQYINGEQHAFRNPIKQNTAHVMAVEQVTRVSSMSIIPLVVFTGSAILKVLDCGEVIYDGELYETIRRYGDIRFSPKQVRHLARILDEAIEENKETKSAHVDQVRERIRRWDQELKAGQCPRCSGRLVLRRGKYGDFYGCSNYPNCTFTKDL